MFLCPDGSNIDKKINFVQIGLVEKQPLSFPEKIVFFLIFVSVGCEEMMKYTANKKSRQNSCDAANDIFTGTRLG